MEPSTLARPVDDKQIFGHPRGLFVLFFAEMWERFSYYGMRALLTLYMFAETKETLLGQGDYKPGQEGLGWSMTDAISIYGTYTMLVYLTPILGGWMADKVLGQRKSIVLGGLLMVAGHFLMAYPPVWAFYTALGLIVCGVGFFKPNISSMVGELYTQGDSRRDAAFTIFYMGINAGALAAPIVCGWLQAKYGWHYGFAAAGVGMVVGQIIFQYNPKGFFGNIGAAPSKEPGEKNELTVYDKTMQNRIYTILCGFAATVVLLFAVAQAFMMYGLEQQTVLEVQVKSSSGRILGQGAVQLRFAAPEASSETTAASSADDPAVLPGRTFFVPATAKEGDVLGQLVVNTDTAYTLTIKEETNIEQSFGLTSQNELVLFKQDILTHYPSAYGNKSFGWPAIWLWVYIIGTVVFVGFGLYYGGQFRKTLPQLDATDTQKLGVDEQRVWVIFILGIFTIFFWSGFEQAGGMVNIYTDTSIDRSVTLPSLLYVFGETVWGWFGYENLTFWYDTVIPTSFFQSVNALFILILGPFFSMLWVALSKRGKNLSTPFKMVIGLFLLGLGFLFPIWAEAINASGSAKAGFWLIVMMYMLHTMGVLCLSPVGLSMVTKLAPVGFVSVLMGIWFWYMSLGNKLAGIIGSLAGGLGFAQTFWLLMAISIGASLVLLLIARMLATMMQGRD